VSNVIPMRSHRMDKHPPADGKAYSALLVGTSRHPAAVANVREQLLQEFGVRVDEHWDDPDNVRGRSFPRDCEVVVLLGKCLPNHAIKYLAKRAADAGRRYAIVGMERTKVRNNMQAFGFGPRPQPLPVKRPDPWAPLPEEPEEAPLPEAPSEEQPAPAAPDPEPLPPAAAQDVATPRYVPVPRAAMAAPEVQAVLDLAKAWRGEPVSEFLARVYHATGNYRTSGALGISLRALSVVSPVPAGLSRALEQDARAKTAAKRAALKEEKAAHQRGEQLAHVSPELATAMVGGVSYRLDGQPLLYDTEEGRRVYDGEAVRAVLASYEERGLDLTERGAVKGDLEWERDILADLARESLGASRLCGDSPNGRLALERLMRDGRVLRVERGGGWTYYLPGQPVPEKKLPPPRRPAAPKPVQEEPAAEERVTERLPAADADEVRAELMRLLRAGKMTATEVAETLRAMRGE
jgi:hypothetical protein